MSTNETESEMLIELANPECDPETEKEYAVHIATRLRSREIQTILGTATITMAVVTRSVVNDTVRFHLTAELEFPREDRTYTVSSKSGDSATLLQLLSKDVRKWAMARAAEIIQSEDRRSNTLLLRRIQKQNSRSHAGEFFTYQDCDCEHCNPWSSVK
jgi:hypothetical protein